MAGFVSKIINKYTAFYVGCILTTKENWSLKVIVLYQKNVKEETVGI
jgi:hypothetical protein